MLARLAEARSLAKDLADREAPADELVQANTARRDIAPCLSRRERDPVLVLQGFDDLGLDERQVPADAQVVRVVASAERVAIPLEADATRGLDRIESLKRLAGARR